MAKKDFDKYLRGLSITLREDVLGMAKIKEAYAKGETDEKVYKAAEKAFRDDKYRLEIFLFVKALLDKPTRKSKERAWARQSKLPKEMPIKD